MPGLHGVDGDPGPGVGRRLDHHGVELLLLDHLAEVVVDAPLLAAGELLGVLLGLRDLQSQAATTWKPFHVGPFADQPGAAAAADHAHADRLAGRGAVGSPRTLAGTRAGKARAALALRISRREMLLRDMSVPPKG